MRTHLVKLDLQNCSKRLTRDGYGEGLLLAAEENPNVVALGADISESVRVSWFKERYPERFISLGISEQNQMGVAAGLSLVGKVPFVTNYGVFLAGRAWDQIRTTVCYANLNVKLGGAHGGISVGPDGATHQALEEISIMRCLPNMSVVVPADYDETRKATLAAARMRGPVYIRFGREKVPSITDADAPFEFGKAYCLREGKDAVIIACGAMVYESLVAAETLAKEGIECMVVNCHTIKPLDTDAIVEAAKHTGAVVTAEEHQVYGGLGGAVAETISQKCPVPMRLVGVNDRFGESGDPETLMQAFGLTSEDIANAVRVVTRMKQDRESESR